MNDIAHDILRLVVERHPEWLWADDALPLLEHHGNDLIPGLVTCLSDSDPDVRRVAIGLLAMTRPQSDFAVPLIIERLGDEDRLVRFAAIWKLSQEFGPLSEEVIPYLEAWLERDDEYERIHALTGIVAADPSRTEMLPEIWDAMTSDNPCVRDVALEFFGLAEDVLLFDDAQFDETEMNGPDDHVEPW